ncbi:lipase ROG1 [Stagonosporopsis vannaccii]|nr:lipase ROG1 [Stagonosporopsis vannaccii]
MLLTPRTYSLAQTDSRPGASYLLLTPSQREIQAEAQRARKMLLLHQTGSVKVGEVVRYTVTYTPSEDRILPAPAFLHVRIRNTSALPLRAAYLHGPYTVHVAAYPSTFHPNKKVESPKTYGVPEFEPNLKAGGYWNARLTVPEHIRQGDEWRNFDGTPKSATWIIEVDSQIIFSNSASVSYELLVARDERSLDLGFTAVTGNSSGVPGKVQDHQQGKKSHTSHHPAQPKGVFSKAIKLVVDDTTSLWNKPELPEHKDEESDRRKSKDVDTEHKEDTRKQRNVHLVMVTHGLHSNLGADMLYLKESIDATAKQAREDRRRRRQERRGQKSKTATKDTAATAPLSGGQEDIADEEEDDDEEDVIVRGFDGNVVRTERGIQYLGKRLAKHVLRLTYPDQPYLPIKKSVGQKLNPFSPVKDKPTEGEPIHEGSGIHFKPYLHKRKRAYKFTSISFIGHSLGGLIQTYAIAYIYKHSPDFFEHIKPINFIAMASPMLGLSNENPMYVKFALDFGLVGRTGQDLGLTWRAPTLAKSGWTAMVSGFGGQSQHQEQEDPGTKPLLRILPTGPAHVVLRMFRNRTVYSNVVNDGVVPLRTSCLLFLDWRGLGKVEKARRENGLIGSVAVWGFSQLTGQNSSPNPSRIGFQNDNDEIESPSGNGDDSAVPLPGADVTNEDDRVTASEPAAHQFLDGRKHDPDETVQGNPGVPVSDQYFQPQNTLMQWWSYIRPTGKHTSRDKKMFTRSQTVFKDDDQQEAVEGASSQDPQQRKRPIASRGDSTLDPSKNSAAPPKTTIFESAGDIINPPVPPMSWIIDPSTRARTIFHDRVYHPEDIPPPPARKRSNNRTFSGESLTSQASTQTSEETMRVEEKIARAYHKDLSWRKVLVRLEPDAHNNIVVRRMFANAYGWPVVKHLCDTHFADTYSAQTRDEQEPALDRAKAIDVPVKEDGEHVKGQEDTVPPIERTESELREVRDELAPLGNSFRSPKRMNTADSFRSTSSADWDNYFDGATSDEDDDNDERNAVQKFLQLGNPRPTKSSTTSNAPRTPNSAGTSDAEISDFLNQGPEAAQPTPLVDIHRGLGASPRQPSKATKEPDSQQSLRGQAILPPGHQVAASPPASPSLHLSDVGLRRSLEGSPDSNRVRSGGTGVTEQVARSMSTAKDRERS